MLSFKGIAQSSTDHSYALLQQSCPDVGTQTPDTTPPLLLAVRVSCISQVPLRKDGFFK